MPKETKNVWCTPGKVQIALRITDADAKRLDDLIPRYQKDEMVQATGRKVTRATILRLAMKRGLASLYEEIDNS